MTFVEAASVSSIGEVFKQSSIKSFRELRWFTSLRSIATNAFARCVYLTHGLILPEGVTSVGHNIIGGSGDGYFRDIIKGHFVDFPSTLRTAGTTYPLPVIMARGNESYPVQVQKIFMRPATPPSIQKGLITAVTPNNANSIQRIIYIPQFSINDYMDKGYIQDMVRIGWIVSATL